VVPQAAEGDGEPQVRSDHKNSHSFINHDQVPPVQRFLPSIEPSEPSKEVSSIIFGTDSSIPAFWYIKYTLPSDKRPVGPITSSYSWFVQKSQLTWLAGIWVRLGSILLDLGPANRHPQPAA
jgi:hypothetical protein